MLTTSFLMPLNWGAVISGVRVCVHGHVYFTRIGNIMKRNPILTSRMRIFRVKPHCGREMYMHALRQKSRNSRVVEVIPFTCCPCCVLFVAKGTYFTDRPSRVEVGCENTPMLRANIVPSCALEGVPSCATHIGRNLLPTRIVKLLVTFKVIVS